MEREVVYSAVSLIQLDRICAYLFAEWGAQVTDKFLEEFRYTVKRLAQNPETGTATEFNRFSFPLRMYRIHYLFDDKNLEIAFLQDMRSNKEMIDIK